MSVGVLEGGVLSITQESMAANPRKPVAASDGAGG